MRKVVLWGAGKALDKIINEKKFCEYAKWNIVAVVDNDKEKQGTNIRIWDEWIPIISVDEFCVDDGMPVVVTSEKYFGEIKAQLIVKGCRESDIINLGNVLNEYIASRFPMRLLCGNRVEIGGPSKIFEPIYKKCNSCDGVNYAVNTVWCSSESPCYSYGDEIIGSQIISDATDLSAIKTGTYDFLLSSNNLEHIANPLKAVSEFCRVVRGVIVLLVPNKKYTFDHRRETSTFEHLLADYENNVGEDDLTHLDEILDKHDLMLDKPAGTIEEFRKRSMDNYNNRCLHHHVFDLKLLEQIADYFGLLVLMTGELLENYMIVMKKR